MRIADSLRGRCVMQERHSAGLDAHVDRLPARVRSREWHTGRAKGRAKATRPSSGCLELAFTRGRLGELRRFVAQGATEASLDPARIGDLVLAINELATNSVLHAGGGGTLRIWKEGDVLLCDVRDQGYIPLPSVCPITPEPTQITGRGLWIVGQLCDLVQIRNSRRGSVVRVHMRLT